MRKTVPIALTLLLTVFASAQEATLEEKLTGAVATAKNKLIEGTKMVGEELVKIAEEHQNLPLPTDPKSYDQQFKYLTALRSHANNINTRMQAIHKKIGDSKLGESETTLKNALGELATCLDQKATEADTRAKNAQPKLKTLYERDAASLRRLAKAYRDDLADLEKNKIEDKLSQFAEETEYAGWFVKTVDSVVFRLKNVNDLTQIRQEIETLSAQLTEISKGLEAFSQQVLYKGTLSPVGAETQS